MPTDHGSTLCKLCGEQMAADDRPPVVASLPPLCAPCLEQFKRFAATIKVPEHPIEFASLDRRKWTNQ